MSEIDRENIPEIPVDVNTRQIPEKGKEMPEAARVTARDVADPMKEEEVFEVLPILEKSSSVEVLILIHLRR